MMQFMIGRNGFDNLCKGLVKLCLILIIADLFIPGRILSSIVFLLFIYVYFRAFSRLVLLVKGGVVGSVKSIDATCTSMQPSNNWFYNKESKGGSMTDWGPFVLLPVFKIFGLCYRECTFICSMDETKQIDMFTQVNMLYPHGTATFRTGYGVKSEGSLVISGTKAYIYVPSPWWRTEYFEIRYENFNNNRRYFYKVDGEGIRYELAEFLRMVRTKENNFTINKCENCGRLFIPSTTSNNPNKKGRNDQKYCNNLYLDTGKTLNKLEH